MVGHKAFIKHKSISPDQVHSRIGNAEPFMILGDVGVQNAVLPDHATLFVREEVIGNVVFFYKLSENVLRVRTNGENPDIVAVKRLQVALQLDELRLAESSPRGASVKQNERLACAPDIREANEIPEMIR
jgi:hypothetical protein